MVFEYVPVCASRRGKHLLEAFSTPPTSLCEHGFKFVRKAEDRDADHKTMPSSRIWLAPTHAEVMNSVPVPRAWDDAIMVVFGTCRWILSPSPSGNEAPAPAERGVKKADKGATSVRLRFILNRTVKIGVFLC